MPVDDVRYTVFGEFNRVCEIEKLFDHEPVGARYNHIDINLDSSVATSLDPSLLEHQII